MMKFLKVAALMLVMAVGGAQPFPSRDVGGGSWTTHNPTQIMILAAVCAAAVIAQKIYGNSYRSLQYIFKQTHTTLLTDEDLTSIYLVGVGHKKTVQSLPTQKQLRYVNQKKRRKLNY
jgi:hypothetical protein